MLTRGGNEPSKRIELPQEMTWRAFQISVHGVGELSFPVVLQRPNHHDPRSKQDDEEVLIIGDAPTTQTYFQIGSRLSGVTAAASGPGRGISKRNTYNVHMPERGDRHFQSKVSMLTRDALQKRPYDSLQFGDVRMQITRTPIK